MNARHALFLLLVLVAVAQVAYYTWFGQLPEVVASHFDGQGNADGFMSRTLFLGIHLGAVGLVSLIFLALPLLLTRMPPAMINLPHKDYWLCPERKKATFDHVTRQFMWFGSATLALLVVVMEAAIRANLPGGGGRLNPSAMWCALGAYAAFTVLWVVLLITRYARVPG